MTVTEKKKKPYKSVFVQCKWYMIRFHHLIQMITSCHFDYWPTHYHEKICSRWQNLLNKMAIIGSRLYKYIRIYGIICTLQCVFQLSCKCVAIWTISVTGKQDFACKWITKNVCTITIHIKWSLNRLWPVRDCS